MGKPPELSTAPPQGGQASLPFLGILLIALAIITFVPELTLLLVR